MSLKENKIRFSVVTIIFNGAGFIEKTLDSVTNQTYTNLQYIIIDGNSTDNTLEIVEKYRDKIDVVISENDTGIYDAMNKGIKVCDGDFVIFMNGGDFFCANNVLDKIAYNLKSKKNLPDFIYGDSYIDYGNGSEFLYKKARNSNYSWYGMFANHQSMVYSLKLINGNNLMYDLSYRISADYKFTIQFLDLASEILYLNFPFCVFSIGGLSVIQRDLGLKEAEKARYEVFRYGKFRMLAIRLLIYTARFTEDYMSGVHKYLRFSKPNS